MQNSFNILKFNWKYLQLLLDDGKPMLIELHTEFVSLSMSFIISRSIEDKVSSPKFKSSSKAFPENETECKTRCGARVIYNIRGARGIV